MKGPRRGSSLGSSNTTGSTPSSDDCDASPSPFLPPSHHCLFSRLPVSSLGSSKEMRPRHSHSPDQSRSSRPRVPLRPPRATTTIQRRSPASGEGCRRPEGGRIQIHRRPGGQLRPRQRHRRGPGCYRRRWHGKHSRCSRERSDPRCPDYDEQGACRRRRCHPRPSRPSRQMRHPSRARKWQVPSGEGGRRTKRSRRHRGWNRQRTRWGCSGTCGCGWLISVWKEAGVGEEEREERGRQGGTLVRQGRWGWDGVEARRRVADESSDSSLSRPGQCGLGSRPLVSKLAGLLHHLLRPSV